MRTREEQLADRAAPRVVVAMSGGVDSAVAAWLLKKRGFDVVGVTMQIWPDVDPTTAVSHGGCCSVAAASDARRVAAVVGIPFYVLNFQSDFEREVIQDFCREYARGRTPNPCLVCNSRIKFSLLAGRAQQLGASYLATGHYARVEHCPQRGRYLLKKGVDPAKDQSYALYAMTQDQLAHTLFPLGEYTKEQVRRWAAEAGLPVATKPESQEICFVVDGDYRAFLRERIPDVARPGPIVDRSGRRLGTHGGVAGYTVGQRRGLGLPGPEPYYVLEIDAPRNTLVVGTRRETLSGGLLAVDCNFVSVRRLDRAQTACVKIRYRAPEVPCSLEAAGPGQVAVRFQEPQAAVTPGQAAVFYQGDEVLGGGTIERPLP
ncbi:MAG: tRNA 2-thiouridine(34) synthase MnmA [Bacillota bacterium]